VLGNVAGVFVDGQEVRDRQIETWPWYSQTIFGGLTTWAFAGVWSRRKDLW